MELLKVLLNLITSPLVLNSVPIEQVNNTNFLGVVIDSKLDWSNQISYINAKIAQRSGHNMQLQKYFTSSALINVYNTCILPYMIYCVEVWGNAFKHPYTPAHKI